MRRHLLPSLALLVPLGVVLMVASCAESTDIGGYTVTYRVNTVGVATVDSVKYDNGTGTLVKVTAPATTWTVNFVVPSGSTVEAQAWAQGTAAGTAKLAVIWMTKPGALAGDSTSAATAAGTALTMSLAKRTL